MVGPLNCLCINCIACEGFIFCIRAMQVAHEFEFAQSGSVSKLLLIRVESPRWPHLLDMMCEGRCWAHRFFFFCSVIYLSASISPTHLSHLNQKPRSAPFFFFLNCLPDHIAPHRTPLFPCCGCRTLGFEPSQHQLCFPPTMYDSTGLLVLSVFVVFDMLSVAALS